MSAVEVLEAACEEAIEVVEAARESGAPKVVEAVTAEAERRARRLENLRAGEEAGE